MRYVLYEAKSHVSIDFLSIFHFSYYDGDIQNKIGIGNLDILLYFYIWYGMISLISSIQTKATYLKNDKFLYKRHQIKEHKTKKSDIKYRDTSEYKQ